MLEQTCQQYMGLADHDEYGIVQPMSCLSNTLGFCLFGTFTFVAIIGMLKIAYNLVTGKFMKDA